MIKYPKNIWLCAAGHTKPVVGCADCIKKLKESAVDQDGAARAPALSTSYPSASSPVSSASSSIQTPRRRNLLGRAFDWILGQKKSWRLDTVFIFCPDREFVEALHSNHYLRARLLTSVLSPGENLDGITTLLVHDPHMPSSKAAVRAGLFKYPFAAMFITSHRKDLMEAMRVKGSSTYVMNHFETEGPYGEQGGITVSVYKAVSMR